MTRDDNVAAGLSHPSISKPTPTGCDGCFELNKKKSKNTNDPPQKSKVWRPSEWAVRGLKIGSKPNKQTERLCNASARKREQSSGENTRQPHLLRWHIAVVSGGYATTGPVSFGTRSSGRVRWLSRKIPQVVACLVLRTVVSCLQECRQGRSRGSSGGPSTSNAVSGTG